MNTLLSVVIPVYNQYRKLEIVLQHFSRQRTEGIDFEIIIIDDGSIDELSKQDNKSLKIKYGINNIEILHTINGGRAIARNNGINAAQGEFIIFCDADRIPNEKYLSQYKKAAGNHNVIVGGAMDFFGPIQLAYQPDNRQLFKWSRYPQYYKSACENLFDSEGNSNSEWSWLGFLVGNSCVKKEILTDIGGFSEDFSDWGFEHFEMAYRIMKTGERIINLREIVNFHLVHSRPTGFYKEYINKSIDLMGKKHSINTDVLKKLFFDNSVKYNFQILGGSCK